MAKKVSEANKGIQALAREAPEVVKRMGYAMKMGKIKNNSPINFSEQDEITMAGSNMFNLGGLPDVSNVPGKIYGTDTSFNSLTPSSRKIEADPVTITAKHKSKEERIKAREQRQQRRAERRADRMAKRNK
jgi:hypothetical protein